MILRPVSSGFFGVFALDLPPMCSRLRAIKFPSVDVDNAYMGWRMSIRVLVILFLSASSLAAQVSHGGFQISARIARGGSLALAAADPERVLGSAIPGLKQVQVRLRPSSGNRIVTVPLIARSNAPYRLAVKSDAPLRISVTSATPNGGSAHLMADATNVRAVPIELVEALEEVTIVQGPRISSGGNDLTVDNAIRLALEVEFPQTVSEAELIVTMIFPEN